MHVTFVKPKSTRKTVPRFWKIKQMMTVKATKSFWGHSSSNKPSLV